MKMQFKKNIHETLLKCRLKYNILIFYLLCICKCKPLLPGDFIDFISRQVGYRSVEVIAIKSNGLQSSRSIGRIKKPSNLGNRWHPKAWPCACR